MDVEREECGSVSVKCECEVWVWRGGMVVGVSYQGADRMMIAAPTNSGGNEMMMEKGISIMTSNFFYFCTSIFVHEQQ